MGADQLRVDRVSSKGCEGNGQFEECIGNLQHQDVRMVMLMADQYSFARPSHAMQLVVLLQPLQSRNDRRVFFRLIFLGAEGVVAQWV